MRNSEHMHSEKLTRNYLKVFGFSADNNANIKSFNVCNCGPNYAILIIAPKLKSHLRFSD